MGKLQSSIHGIQVLGWDALRNMGRIRRINQETIRGYCTTRVMIALIDVGLIQALMEQPRVDLVAFAKSNGYELPTLQIMCDYLYAQRYLDRSGAEYWLDAGGKLLVDTALGAFDIMNAYRGVFDNMAPMVRGEKRYGVDIQRDSALVARGSGGVGRRFAFPLMAAEINRRGLTKVLDLGCGDAGFLGELCKSNPQITARGVDIAPEAVELGNQRLAQAGLSDRVQLFVGDIFNAPVLARQAGDVQVATSVYVIHEFQEQIVAALQRLREALPGVPLLLCEVIRHTPEELRAKPGAIMEILLFHELSNQRLYTRAEWREMFAAGGYSNVEENYLDFARTALFFVR